MAISEEGLSVEELEQTRDFLLASLEDLDREREAGDLDDHDYETLRDGYTARAAAVLRALESRDASAAHSGPAPADAAGAQSDTPTAPARAGRDRPRPNAPRSRTERAPRSRARRLRVLAAGTLVAMFAVGAGAFVAASSGNRLPGQGSSGSIPAAEPDQLSRAQELISQGKLLQAVQAYDAVLATDPKNPEALAYKGWLLRLAGTAGPGTSGGGTSGSGASGGGTAGAASQAQSADLINRGQQSVEAAIAADPSYPDAHFFLGMILFQDRNDPVGAITQFRLFMANRPPQEMVALVQSELDQAMQTAKQRGLPDPGPAPGVGVTSGPSTTTAP